MGGFTYNGIHSSTFHVEYVPGAADRWFEWADYETYSENISWRHGGYYYGAKENVREIKLDCWFDQVTVHEREMIRAWLGRNTSGALMLDEMPFVYWNVRPGKPVTGQLYNDHKDGTMENVYSGTFTIVFYAYDPFGYLTRKYNTGVEDDNATDYCGIIDQGDMPAAPTTSSRQFNVYNPGTEQCGLTIRVGGTTTTPIRFFNDTNKTRCELNGLPTSTLVLDIRGDTGLITTHYASGTANEEKNWAYHDGGFVLLEPGLNTILIEGKNSQGWGTASGLTLNHISIDYAPRIL